VRIGGKAGREEQRSDNIHIPSSTHSEALRSRGLSTGGGSFTVAAAEGKKDKERKRKRTKEVEK